MMTKYLETKKEYPDCILFYRLGDFYELFFDDAITGARELEITLTGKDCGLEERAPMCGVPFHSVDSYLSRLVKKGYKVAIAEQVEDPKTAKGIVKREVVRVVTPGTNTDSMALSEDLNNYLLCIYYEPDIFALSFADITTGDFLVTQAENRADLMNEINRFHVAEIISNRAFMISGADISLLKDKQGISFSCLDDSRFDNSSCRELIKRHFNTDNIEELGFSDMPQAVPCAGAMLGYLYETQKTDLGFLNKITFYNSGGYMVLDSIASTNLEITRTIRDKNKKGSLLWVLDKTKTAMGARRLRSFLEQPLTDRSQIISRQDAVEALKDNAADAQLLRENLNCIYDLERLLARISYKSASPRDLLAFKNSLAVLPAIREILKNFSCEALKELYDETDPLTDIYELLEKGISEDAPVSIREGGIIKEGYNEQVDKYRNSKIEGKTWLSQLEEKEREATGIKNLRVRFNKVFGYYIEVTNSFKDLVPERYVRRQTLVNAERYTTQELKQLEDIILGAQEKLFALEYDLFAEIREKISCQVVRIQKTAKAISCIDAYCSLARAAELNRYVRPEINTEGIIEIKDCRHPVVEASSAEGSFIPNDVYCDTDENRVSIITGPNMAGKSTYMRQIALITIMAAAGSFVPASYANISICDRIFTRIGASDDLTGGQSTFMVEMSEVANILNNATKNSLIILDEIGRGTSTYDGLSIAWATVEYIADKRKCGAKTFFSTHYHELTELEGRIPGVKNYCISVKEQGDNIIFLRKIMRGGADKSYGIQVASLAGIPKAITNRAKQIAAMLSAADINLKERITGSQKAAFDEEAVPVQETAAPGAEAVPVQEEAAFGAEGAPVSETAAFSAEGAPAPEEAALYAQAAPSEEKGGRGRKESEAERLLMEINPDELTPRQALDILYELKAKCAREKYRNKNA